MASICIIDIICGKSSDQHCDHVTDHHWWNWIFTWEDIYLHKFHFKHYHMQSKVILTTTLCLILLPAVFFFFQDYGNLSGIHRLLASLFQAVTPRTAGFNTTDLSMLTGASKAMMILLMLIGGSPSSTAGGMKTTTFALLLLNVLATFQSCDDVTAFGRRIDASVIKMQQRSQ